MINCHQIQISSESLILNISWLLQSKWKVTLHFPEGFFLMHILHTVPKIHYLSKNSFLVYLWIKIWIFGHEKLPKIHFLGWFTFYRLKYLKIKIDYVKIDFLDFLDHNWTFNKVCEYGETLAKMMNFDKLLLQFSFLKMTIGKKSLEALFCNPSKILLE